MEKAANNRSPAVERAIDVIELMAREQEIRFSEMLSCLNIPCQSLVRILNSLWTRGIVEKTKRREGINEIDQIGGGQNGHNKKGY